MLMAADSVNSCATADAATASTRTNASARALMPRIIRSRSGGPALLDDRESPVHEEDQDEQEHSQRDGRVEVALARLEHHRRGQRTRVALDVAADHQRGADLGDDGAEAGHDGGQHRQPSLPQHDPHHLSARGAERDELETERLGNVLDGGQRDAGHDRRGDHRLRDNHRDRRVEDLQHAERPAPPEQDRDEEADDDRRQAHAGVHRADEQPAARETPEGERDAGGYADQQRHQRRRARHQQRQPQHAADLGVARDEQPEGLTESVDKEIHSAARRERVLQLIEPTGRDDKEQRDADDHFLSPTSASFIPATGTNNGWPNFSRPKVLITRWVSGATMKSANALPPAVFTRGPLAGFTSSTE